MMTLLRRGRPVLFLAVLVCTACARGEGPSAELSDTHYEVAEAEAREVLDQTVALIQAGRVREVCMSGSSSRPICSDTEVLARAPANQPAPTVLSSRRQLGSDCSADGRVLVITGVDAVGGSFTSEFHVSRLPDGTLTSRFPVYWFHNSGITYPGYCG